MTRRWLSKIDRTEVNIAAVADLVKKDYRIASRMIAESFNFLKAVVLRIMKHDFCSRDIFFLLLDNAPTHKAASVCQLLAQKDVKTVFHPHILQIYLRQTFVLSPSSK
jgi:hypothetical protein